MDCPHMQGYSDVPAQFIDKNRRRAKKMGLAFRGGRYCIGQVCEPVFTGLGNQPRPRTVAGRALLT